MAACRGERGRLALRDQSAVGRLLDAARPVGRHRRGAHGRAGRGYARDRGRHHSRARTGASPRSGRCIRRPSGWNGPSAISTASCRSACPTTGPGSISASGMCSIPSGSARDAPATRAPYAFLPAEGESLHQIPVGPVHAGIIEPGHFRFTANGETVVRLEERLGYVHKGIEGLMAGATLDEAARLAGRTSGDSTVAYALAFAHAVEAAAGVQVPPRAIHLRALMAELERLANHFGDIGAVCNDASFSLMHAHCGVLRERTLRAADACFGHRLMMDAVLPGGVARDLAADGVRHVAALLQDIRRVVPRTDRALRQHRLAAGPHRLAPASCAPSWRGSSAPAAMSDVPAAAPSMRARRPDIGRTISSTSTFRSCRAGDVNARVWVRIREVEQSLGLIEQILEHAARRRDSDRARVWRRGMREGLGLAEAFAATCWRGSGSKATAIARCHLRDPSWFQWPLLEAAIEGNIVADFPLCNKSFNCSYSGHDL